MSKIILRKMSVESITFTQLYWFLKFILVDDGSTDISSSEMCDELLKRLDERIKK